ncbi:MAG: GNAT family N-acetyltransferase [Actinomycetia bacterium]|nr:GNAT family N-acetyltransferase [Actinomycetes bacterium]
MQVDFREVRIPDDHEQLAEFLCNDEWPFHGQRKLTSADIAAMEFSTTNVATFWVIADGRAVGLVRLLDLADIGDGAPLFDLRIGSAYRSRGFGLRAVRWLVDYLFTTYPELHRTEANTRHDNTAMQRILTAAGFTQEGRLRDAWKSDDGKWCDTLIYGILRSDVRN